MKQTGNLEHTKQPWPQGLSNRLWRTLRVDTVNVILREYLTRAVEGPTRQHVTRNLILEHGKLSFRAVACEAKTIPVRSCYELELELELELEKSCSLRFSHNLTTPEVAKFGSICLSDIFLRHSHSWT